MTKPVIPWCILLLRAFCATAAEEVHGDPEWHPLGNCNRPPHPSSRLYHDVVQADITACAYTHTHTQTMMLCSKYRTLTCSCKGHHCCAAVSLRYKKHAAPASRWVTSLCKKKTKRSSEAAPVLACWDLWSGAVCKSDGLRANRCHVVMGLPRQLADIPPEQKKKKERK